jgi:hypothetical protein
VLEAISAFVSSARHAYKPWRGRSACAAFGSRCITKLFAPPICCAKYCRNGHALCSSLQKQSRLKDAELRLKFGTLRAKKGIERLQQRTFISPIPYLCSPARPTLRDMWPLDSWPPLSTACVSWMSAACARVLSPLLSPPVPSHFLCDSDA